MTIQFKPASIWTDSKVRTLKEKWAQGLSASQVARALGPEFSCSAVIGKLARLGLQRGIVQHAVRSKPLVPRVHVPKPEPVAAVDEPEPLRLTIMEISDRACRWPIGDPGTKEFAFCGHAPKFGSPYCAVHHAKSYQSMHAPRVHAPRYG